MTKEYVERRDDTLYLIGSRVPLVSIVYEFLNGATAETIQSSFPTLTLEQVYGAITFYLANREESEKDMEEHWRAEEEFIRTHPGPVGLRQRLLARREQMLASRQADR